MDKDGHCTLAIHAEENAIIQCARTGISSVGTAVYSTHLPCIKCSLRLIQAGVHKIMYESEYGDVGEIVHLLDEARVKLWRYDNGLLQPIL
jgi:dCMP deaminase